MYCNRPTQGIQLLHIYFGCEAHEMDGWMVNQQAETLSVRYQEKYKSKRDPHNLPHLLCVSKKVTIRFSY